MLKSLVTDKVTYVVQCVSQNFARACKDINTSWSYMAIPWKYFCRFVSSTLLQLLRILTTSFKLESFFVFIPELALHFLFLYASTAQMAEPICTHDSSNDAVCRKSVPFGDRIHA
jgi:hypothetical protein